MEESDDMLEFTPDLYEKLKKEYNKALEEEQESFEFEGREVLTNYAKYMVEYLNTQFKK